MAEFMTLGSFGRGETDPSEMYYLTPGQTSYHIPGLNVDKELSPCDELLYKKLGAWWGKNPNPVAKKLYPQFFAICSGSVGDDKYRRYINQWIDWKTGKGEEPAKPTYKPMPIPEQKPPIAGKIKTGVAAVVMILAAAGIYYGVKELRK